MPVSDAGILWQSSVTEITSADHTQDGGCMRRFWFDRRHDLRGEQTRSQAEGVAGHAHLEAYFRTGAMPPRRALMSKAVTGAILKGELPKPGEDLIVEARFDGGEKLNSDGTWRPLDTAETLHLAGVPLDGFIDLTFRRGDVPEVWDHKFSSDIQQHAKPSAKLIETVQMPVYVLSQLPYWPDARRWRIVHHYVSKRGVASVVRGAVVELDQVLERKAAIEAVLESMKIHARASDQNDVPHNSKRACDQFGGCPHQSICRAYQERNTVQLTPEEAALFEGLDDAPAAEVAPPPPAPAPEPAPAKAHRMPIVDVPPPAPAEPPAYDPPPCKCGAKITAENGSRLSSGEWRHVVGCPLNKPAAPPAPAAPPPAPAPAPIPPPAAAAPVPEPKKRGRPPKAPPAPLPPPPAPELADAGQVAAAVDAGAKALNAAVIADVQTGATPAAPPAIRDCARVGCGQKIGHEGPCGSVQGVTLTPLDRDLMVSALSASVKREGAREALAAVLENLAVLVRGIA